VSTTAAGNPSRDELKPGDLVFFQNTYSAGLSHNGIFIATTSSSTPPMKRRE